LSAVTINGHWCTDLQNSAMNQYILNFMSVKEL
jgi:hypothetical protein